MKRAWILMWVLLVATNSGAAHRSSAAKHEFQRAHACPATGSHRGPCPGYIIDHVQPLCAGGPDRPDNMQWQSTADARAKDRLERRQCSALRRSAG